MQPQGGGESPGEEAGPHQGTTQLEQAQVGDLPGEGDVEDGKPGAGVGHHPQQAVRGDVLDVHRVETFLIFQKMSSLDDRILSFIFPLNII